MVGKKQAVKTISLLWVASIMGAGCAFLTQVLLARELGSTAFGAFSAALAMVMLVAPLASFGVGGFWLKAFGEEGWQAVRWLRGSLKYTLLSTSLVLMGLFFWAMLGPHDVSTRNLLMVLSVYLLGQVTVELVSAKFQLEERYLSLALWQFLPHLLRLMLVAMLALVIDRLMTLSNVAYAYALISVLVFLFGLLFMWRMYGGQVALKGHGEVTRKTEPAMPLIGIRQVAVQSWPFGLAGVFYLIYFQSDIILLKYISGDEVAGIYNVAFVIMTAVYMLPSVIYQKFLLPKIHRWANHDRKKFYQVYRTGNWVMLILGILAMLLIWLLSAWGIPLLFGDEYTDAVLPLSILALVAPVRFLNNSVGSSLTTIEFMKKKVFYMGGVALINIIMNFLFIPMYGAVGASISTVLSELMLLACYFIAVKAVFSKADRCT